MGRDRLAIAEVETKVKESKGSKNSYSWKLETQAKMERLWMQSKEQFDPKRDVISQQQFMQAFDAICQIGPLIDKKVADLGCGSGGLSLLIQNQGAFVDAVDAAENALSTLRKENCKRICPIQDIVPYTSLPDDAYDIVVCTEIIGFLPKHLHRLFFSELSRLVNLNGYVVCSTEFDLSTEGALEHFNALVETEFVVEKWFFSYHRLFSKLCHVLETPERLAFLHTSRQTESKIEEYGFFKKWLFKINTTKIGSFFWKGIACFSSPMANHLRQNQWIMKRLEKISRFIWNQEGISHALFIGKRRSLT